MVDADIIPSEIQWYGESPCKILVTHYRVESCPDYAKNTEWSFLALRWVFEVQIFISIVPITLLDCGDHDRAYQDRSFTPPMETLEPFSAPVLEFLSPLCWERHRPSAIGLTVRSAHSYGRLGIGKWNLLQMVTDASSLNNPITTIAP